MRNKFIIIVEDIIMKTEYLLGIINSTMFTQIFANEKA